MLYSLTQDQLAKLSNSHFMPEFTNAEMLVATFETDPGVARQILPKPLTFSSNNMASAFVARYPETNFGCIYSEGALFLNCAYKGEKGFYCLSMPVDDDMALIGGREQFGYPKKIADRITLQKTGNTVIGNVVRKGTEILRIESQLSTDASEDFMQGLAYPTKDWNGIACKKIVSFLFKFFPSPSGDRFDYLPRLVRQPTLFRPRGQLRAGSGSVMLGSTPYDPLAEIVVGRITSMFYGKFDNTMLPGKVMARVWNPMRFAKHAFFKNDYLPTLLDRYNSSQAEKAKAVLALAKKY
jgi:acetoacetate decarboxylase